MRLIECVPNFSEGRDARVVARLREAIASVPGVHLLDWSSDASHHRSVITFVASPDEVAEAAFAGIAAARELIDLRGHRGVHPRIGAADVVPFVPLGSTTMEECVAIARALGERVGRELEIPVYLYGEAALVPERRLLANVRRGEVEGLREMLGTEPSRDPDFGPRRVHPTFGAVAIGARPVLVAFNMYIGDASAMPIARAVARAVRESSGGLPGVRALALEVDGQAQVSMNLADLARTPLRVAADAVRREARARGADVTWSELIGLVPEQEMDAVAAEALGLRDFHGGRVLDRRVREVALSRAVATVAKSGDTTLAEQVASEVAMAGVLHDAPRLDAAVERLLAHADTLVERAAGDPALVALLDAVVDAAEASGRPASAAALRARIASASRD